MENKVVNSELMAEYSSTAVIIDINLVLDYQTLLFCILRKHLASCSGIAMTNADYELLVNKSFSETMQEIKSKYPQVYKNNENIVKEV